MIIVISQTILQILIDHHNNTIIQNLKAETPEHIYRQLIKLSILIRSAKERIFLKTPFSRFKNLAKTENQRIKQHDQNPNIIMLLIFTPPKLVKLNEFRKIMNLDSSVAIQFQYLRSSIPVIAIPLAEIAIQTRPVNLSIHTSCNNLCQYHQQKKTLFSENRFPNPQF